MRAQVRARATDNQLPVHKQHVALLLQFERKQREPGDSGYAAALRQIEQGRKTTHWMWWIWPAFAPLRRQTRHPEFLLPTLESGMAYMARPTLRKNLLQITNAAITQLGGGKTAVDLLGQEDAGKFAECTTFFSVVCIEFKLWVHLTVFVSAVFLITGHPDKRTLGAIGGRYHLVQSREDLMQQTTCDWCHSVRFDIVCGKLCGARYCTSQCQRMAWDQGHNKTCPNKSPRKNRASPIKPAQDAHVVAPQRRRGPLPTSGDANNCTFHALFGVLDRRSKVYFAHSADRMRTCVLEFMGFFANVQEMEPLVLRPKAMSCLAEFYLNDLHRGFVPSTELLRVREEYKESLDELQGRLLSLRLRTSKRVKDAIDRDVAAKSGVGIELLNTLVLLLLRVQPPSRDLHLTRLYLLARDFRKHMADAWPESWPEAQSVYEDRIPLDPMSFQIPQSPGILWNVVMALMDEQECNAIEELVRTDTRYCRRVLPDADEELQYIQLEKDIEDDQAQQEYLATPTLWREMVSFMRQPSQRRYMFKMPDLAFVAQLCNSTITIETPYWNEAEGVGAGNYTPAQARAGLRNWATNKDYAPPRDLFGEEGRHLYLYCRGFDHYERMVLLHPHTHTHTHKHTQTHTHAHTHTHIHTQDGHIQCCFYTLCPSLPTNTRIHLLWRLEIKVEEGFLALGLTTNRYVPYLISELNNSSGHNNLLVGCT